MGLFEISEKEYILIEGTDKVELHIVGVIVKNSNELLVITRDNGIWEWKDKIFSKTCYQLIDSEGNIVLK